MTLRQLFIIFVVGLAVRGAWGTSKLMRAGDPAALEFPDEEQYWLMASSLRAGAGMKDELGFQATRMPLYPAVLSLAAGMPHGVAMARMLQWIVGALAAALTAGIASTLFGRRVGFLAGLLVAADPFLVFFSSLLLTETPFIAALGVLWWMLARRMRGSKSSVACWILVGLAAGLTVYLRESSLGLILAAFVLLAAVDHFRPRTVLGAVLALAVIAASLVPWAARNRRVIGEWCWLTTRAGISLYDGVGPQATGVSDLGNIKQMPAVQSLSEVEWNRYFVRASLQAARSDPSRIIGLAGVKLARTWNPVPNVETYRSPLIRGLSACWTLPTFAAAAAGAFLLLRRRKDGGLCAAVFLLLPALYLSLLHSVFVGSVRYRLGAVPMLEILAAYAVIALADRLRTERTSEDGIVC